MAAQLEFWIDGAVGETREVTVIDGNPALLRIARWSDDGLFARWGEIYVGRVRAVERRLRGAFVDIGQPLDGFVRLNVSDIEGVRQGAMVKVRIAREAARGKGPVLEFLEPSDEPKARRVARPDCDLAIDGARPADPETRDQIDALIDRCLSPTASVRGGGSLTIEPTSAMIAIDVDAGGRLGPADPERFALALNLDAAQAAMREVRLRGLGGLGAIDFVSMRAPAHRKAVERGLAAAAEGDPWSISFAPMSRFGVIEFSRGQMRAPLYERLCGSDGRKTAETIALEALRAVEREARTSRGGKIIAHLAPEAHRWLADALLPWRDLLSSRIGPNWAVVESPHMTRERIEVEVG